MTLYGICLHIAIEICQSMGILIKHDCIIIQNAVYLSIVASQKHAAKEKICNRHRLCLY